MNIKSHPEWPPGWSRAYSADPPAVNPVARALTRSSTRHVVTELFAEADILIDGHRRWDLRVHDERFFRRVLAAGTLGFGEAYMEGWWDCDAIDEMCSRALRAHVAEKLPLNLRTLAATAIALLWNLQSPYRARKAVSAHYDLGNAFFATMLDPTLQYSCAYFSGTDDLAEAQLRKLDLICRKLGLRAGMHLLDIGCGWGGLARFAAANYGCRVVGITLSHEQQAEAMRVCAGLPVEIRLQDYRELTGRFDRIVSIGMLEHVGYKNYRTYFNAAARCLDDGGLFLCHTIGGTRSRVNSDPWLTRHIFPGSMLPSVAQVAAAAEGRLVIEDVHNFGAHYDRTLMAWARNFEAAWPRFAATYGERFGRMWRYYLLSCAAAFRVREIELYQFVLAKGGVPSGYTAVR